jgi:hypothetical protein
LASHPELKSRLLKEFSYADEKIYEVYEIDRSRRMAIRHVVPKNSSIQFRKKTMIGLSPFNCEKAQFEVLDESHITADFQVSWRRPAKPL